LGGDSVDIPSLLPLHHHHLAGEILNHSNWVEFIFLLVILSALVKPVGLYLCKVFDPQGKTGLEFILKPLERITYKLCRIDTTAEQDWKKYTASIFLFTLFCFLSLFSILMFQNILPLNPQKIEGMGFVESFNVAVSFVTNTDWQNYVPEEEVSYFATIFGLVVQNFCSAGVGICVATACIRGIANNSSKSLGNFWVDLIRVSYYLLLPLSLFLSVIFISEGVPQNFKPYTQAHTLDQDRTQLIAQGPMACFESIKLIGSNGGGSTNADSAHPYENPTPFSNWLQNLSILLIPAAQVYYFGKSVQNQKHGWSIYIFMLLLFSLGAYLNSTIEAGGNPLLADKMLDLSEGNMEGKEQRFGVFDSALFATSTTAVSNGAMSSSHTCYLPWAQAILLLNMQTGNIIFGGVGSGLYSLVHLILISTFLAAMMIGRVPQYLGKKIEAFEMKMSLLPVIIYAIGILGLTSLSFMSGWGKLVLPTEPTHGFTGMLYAFSSTMANNGSDFAHINATSIFFKLSTAFSMMAGRFLVILATMALAGSLAVKKRLPEGSGSLRVSGATFIILISAVFLIINALGYLPALLLGPELEHILMNEMMQP
jgi:K+-transporting ATPase ATPase A chain